MKTLAGYNEAMTVAVNLDAFTPDVLTHNEEYSRGIVELIRDLYTDDETDDETIRETIIADGINRTAPRTPAPEARWRIVYENTPGAEDVVFTATKENAEFIARELTAANMENGGGTAEAIPAN